MLNRREFVTSSALLAATSTAGLAFATTPEHTRSTATAELFLVDVRSPLARKHAVKLQAAGKAVATFEGDLLPLWTSGLQTQWRRAPMVVAGLTTAAALFVLETLAADHRMQLLHTETFINDDDGEPLYQWLIVPRGQLV